MMATHRHASRASIPAAVTHSGFSLPPRRTYAQACARITTFNGFDATSTMPGYCLQLQESGSWQLVAAAVTLASGTLPPPFNASAPHDISVDVRGDVVTAAVDGVQLASATDKQFATGNAAIGAGWHQAAFDSVRIDG